MGAFNPAGKWRTREGKLLEMREMSTEHVQNAVRMLERRLAVLDDELAFASAHGFDQESMAAYYAEGTVDEIAVVISYLRTKVNELEDELRRRANDPALRSAP